MIWITYPEHMEAIARALPPETSSRPQTPQRLVEVPAYEGYLTPDDADIARPLEAVQNAVVHGVLDSTVNAENVDQFVRNLGELAEFVT